MSDFGSVGALKMLVLDVEAGEEWFVEGSLGNTKGCVGKKWAT